MTQTDKAAEPVEWQFRVRVKGGAWGEWERGRFLGESPSFMEVQQRPLYAHPQDAEILRVEVERLTAALEAMENRAEVAEYKQRQAVQEVQPMIIARAEKAEAERDAAQSDAREAAQIPSLMAAIDRLTADLATSRAETAMAFEVTAEACDAIAKSAKEYNIPQMAGGAIGCRNDIRKLTTADATAALAARDEATREKALRDAAKMANDHGAAWAEFEGISRVISYAILSLIQEENQ